MPVPLPNLYTLPSDVYDWMSASGVDLRLDDNNQATGQKIQALANALAGATAIQIAALSSPLLNGATLQFGDSGMPAQGQVQLTAVAPVGSTQLTVAPLPQQINALSSALDNGVNLATAARLLKACQYATSQVKLYCCTRYDDNQLVQAWTCNRWATTLAARWLCRRRLQAPSKAIEADAQECLEEMRQVRIGMLAIEDIGTRTSGWPFFSQVEVDVRYEIGRVRVIPLLSEGTPTNYGQLVDYNSIYYLGYF